MEQRCRYWNLYDIGDKFSWGKVPTREGRTVFIDAFTNMQKVLVVYFGIHFDRSCQEVLEVLEDDEDILQGYIQTRFETSLALYFQDI